MLVAMIVITLLAVVVVGVKFAIFNIDVRCLNENLRNLFSKKRFRNLQSTQHSEHFIKWKHREKN